MSDLCCYLHVALSSLTPQNVICHVLKHCFGSFLLQDMFLSLQVHVFACDGQNIKFTFNLLLTCILYCDTRPGCDKNCSQVEEVDSYHGYTICPRTFFFEERCSFTLRKHLSRDILMFCQTQNRRSK